jgi:tryptophanyl-tRNA synthetase
MSKTLLSGVKPTGRPHIGNYFGAMKQFVDLQNEYNSFVFIADLHALTSPEIQDGKILSQNTKEVLADYLAIGLDPEKTTLYKQSDIPEVTELEWYFNCLITVPYLSRAHAFKDAEAKNREINVGVFNYPVLMAADILIVDADVVPVGRDQKQHVEITRDIAGKFNNVYSETFKMPTEMILEEVETVPGIDGQKMSKSYGNTIPLFATDDEIRALVAKIPTDSKAVEEAKDPDTNNIYNIHKILLTPEENTALRQKYSAGGMGYKEAKDLLVADLIKFITPLRDKRDEIIKDEALLLKVLADGKEKVRKVVEAKMAEVRKKVGTAF